MGNNFSKNIVPFLRGSKGGNLREKEREKLLDSSNVRGAKLLISERDLRSTVN